MSYFYMNMKSINFAKYHCNIFIYHFYCVDIKIALRYIGMYIVIDYNHFDIQ